MKTNIALEQIKLAVAEGDDGRAMRIYIENRISYEKYQQACRQGLRLKQQLAGRKAKDVTYDQIGGFPNGPR